LLIVGEVVEYVTHVLKRLAGIELSSRWLFQVREVSDHAGGVGDECPKSEGTEVAGRGPDLSTPKDKEYVS
jgi:hypothetical protein